MSADHCKLVFDSRQLHSGATRTHTGTCGSVQSGKQTVLMRYRRAIERGVEMTAESQWDKEAVTQEGRSAAVSSYIKLKSDPWECNLGLLKTFMLCIEGII